jgi:hypothetical protein
MSSPGVTAGAIASDDESMPPTVLFRLEMIAIEAQQRVKQVEKTCLHSGQG